MPGGFVVGGYVGVQQQQGHTSDVGTPDVRMQLASVGQRQGNLHGLALAAVLCGVAQESQGQPVRVQDGVRFLLPGIAGE